MTEQRVCIIGTRWREAHAEMAYVTRSIAAAASRWAAVSVLVPGGGTEPDGAFDLLGTGRDFRSNWREGLSPGCVVVADRLTPDVAALLEEIGPRAVFTLSALQRDHDPSWRHLSLFGDEESSGAFVNLHVPVNRQAQRHRHNGFGFTGYQLVLSGAATGPDGPPPEAAWLVAAFDDIDVIVVEGGVASAWRGRALRGTATVDSRMDLWRLVAHAGVCIDLAPGTQIARECVEAMRLGTPIVVPRGSGPASAHAQSGGGAVFGDMLELLEATGALRDGSRRSEASSLGRRYADEAYGQPPRFVESLRKVLLGDAA